MKTHPAVQIMLWIVLVLLAQHWHPSLLAAACLLATTLALWLDVAQLLSLLRRTRWIALSLLLIYAYATPGSAVWEALGIWSPTREGLMDGMLQLARLLCALSGLAILLALLPLPRFMAGLYTLAWPLRFFGLSRERFAVRLALTLRYAEGAMRDTAGDWRGAIEKALCPTGSAGEHVELQRQRLGFWDGALLVAAALLLTGMWR